jgi:hypothetical protein
VESKFKSPYATFEQHRKLNIFLKCFSAHKLPKHLRIFILRRIYTFLLLSLSVCSFGQDAMIHANQFGLNAGASFSVGTHVYRIGLFAGAYYYYSHVQVNTLGKATYNFKHLGPKGRGWEKQMGIGLVYGFKDGTSNNPFHHLVSNQMGWRHSVGFGYNYYKDDWETSQFTGTVGYQGGNFELIHENDAFGSHGGGGRGRDADSICPGSRPWRAGCACRAARHTGVAARRAARYPLVGPDHCRARGQSAHRR